MQSSLALVQMLHANPLSLWSNHTVPCFGLTWRVTLNDRMVVHLESGIATAACEAYNMVLAVIYHDSRLIDGDVISPHIEDDKYFSLILEGKKKKWMQNKLFIVLFYIATICPKCFIDTSLVFQLYCLSKRINHPEAASGLWRQELYLSS